MSHVKWNSSKWYKYKIILNERNGLIRTCTVSVFVWGENPVPLDWNTESPSLKIAPQGELSLYIIFMILWDKWQFCATSKLTIFSKKKQINNFPKAVSLVRTTCLYLPLFLWLTVLQKPDGQTERRFTAIHTVCPYRKIWAEISESEVISFFHLA